MAQIQDLESLPVTSTVVLKRVNALLKLQDTFEDINEEMQKEIMEIEKKYALRFEPLWEKRSEIVKGTYEPTEEESTPKEKLAIEVTDKDEKGIPNFWLNVLKNHSQFGSLIETVDEEPLSHLVDIKFGIDTEKELKGEFFFTENAYFSNTSITKTITFSEEGEVESIVNTPIEWKEGKNFTIQKVQKKTQSKGRGKKTSPTVRTVEEIVPCFFSSFLCPSEDESEESADELVFLQYQCLATLKDLVAPNAIDWFLGRGEEEDGQFDDDYDGEDFDDEDDQEDEEDIPQPKGRGAKGGAPQVPNGQDCKQQ